jgi:hypothetical protein
MTTLWAALRFLLAMRYRVKARIKPGYEKSLLDAIDRETLGKGSIAGDEYQHNMKQARIDSAGVATWVETCSATRRSMRSGRIGKSISSCSP